MSDRIHVRGLTLFARHGVAPEEKALGQRFILDISAALDLRPAGISDDLGKTVGYDAIIARASAAFTERSYDLIEAAAEAVAQALLAAFPLIERVAVEVRKPSAPIDAVFADVAVAIERTRRG